MISLSFFVKNKDAILTIIGDLYISEIIYKSHLNHASTQVLRTPAAHA